MTSLEILRNMQIIKLPQMAEKYNRARKMNVKVIKHLNVTDVL